MRRKCDRNTALRACFDVNNGSMQSNLTYEFCKPISGSFSFSLPRVALFLQHVICPLQCPPYLKFHAFCWHKAKSFLLLQICCLDCWTTQQLVQQKIMSDNVTTLKSLYVWRKCAFMLTMTCVVFAVFSFFTSFFLISAPLCSINRSPVWKLLWMTSFVNLCGSMHLTVHCSYELKIFMRISYITTVL